MSERFLSDQLLKFVQEDVDFESEIDALLLNAIKAYESSKQQAPPNSAPPPLPLSKPSTSSTPHRQKPTFK